MVWLLMFTAVFAKKVVKRQDNEFPEQGPPCTTDSGVNGVCSPLNECPSAFDTIEILARNTCPMQEGNGVCCPDQPVGIGASPIGPPSVVPVFSTDTLTLRSNDIGDSGNIANSVIELRDALERELLQRGLFVQPGTTEDLHNAIVFADPQSRELGRQGLLAEETSKDLSTRLQVSASALPSVSLSQTPVATACPKEPTCPATKYRSFDGSCNNVEHKDWGKSFRAFQRMTPSQYADGLQQPRVATDGTPLPSARLVSSTILKDRVKEFPDISALYMAYGQFVDHDLTLTPSARGANNTGILCCPPRITDDLRHPECLQIEIPSNDPFYSGFSQTCMEFVRTISAPPPTCTLGPREQINQLTNYIDASQIYGSNDEQAERLRSKSGGKLTAGGGSGGREFPPHRDGGGCRGGNVGSGLFCFQAGDVRSTEQPQLATLQVAFFREHNRIADELAKLNPGWGDEQLYQESRRILGAIMQHITYNEYLPLVLGTRVMKRFNLLLNKEGYKDSYDANLDATIFNEFATAAFRFGHSTVPSVARLVNENLGAEEQRLRTKFLQPYETRLFDNYVRGSLVQGSEFIDEDVTQELTNHLFETGNRGFGLDLPALNMQRGRDHAIGSYTQVRKICGLEEVQSFQDLNKYMDSSIATQFSQLYK